MKTAANWILAGLCVCLIAGCDRAATPPGNSGPPTGSTKVTDDKAAGIAATLAKLGDEDRAAAEKQKDCPVSGEPLGSMGVPLKLTVSERDVWICCKGCEGSLKSDPEKYLAKLDN